MFRSLVAVFLCSFFHSLCSQVTVIADHVDTSFHSTAVSITSGATRLVSGDPAELNRYIDSTYSILDSVKEYCNMGVLQVYKSFPHAYNGDQENVDSLLTIAEALALKCTKPSYVMYGVYNSRHVLAATVGQNSAADSLLGLAIAEADILQDTKKVAYGLANRGVMAAVRGENVKALPFLFEALEYGRELKDTAFITGMNATICGVYLGLKQNQEGIPYCRKAVDISATYPAKYHRTVALNNLGAIYKNTGENENAIDAYRESLRTCQKANLKSSSTYAYNGLGSLFLELDQLDSARLYFSKGYAIEKELGYRNEQVNSLRSLAELSKKQGRHREALALVEEGISLGEELGILDELLELKKLRLGISLPSFSEIADQDFQDVLTYIDSINSEEKVTLASEYEVKYKTQEKQAQNDILVEKQKLNLAQIEKQRLLLAAFSVGVLGLLFGLYFLYKNNRNKRLYIRKLDAKNNLIQSLSEETVHRTKNYLNLATSLLSSQKYTTKDEEVVAALSENEKRMDVLSQISSKLTPTPEGSLLNLKSELEELCANLTFSLGNDASRRLKIDASIPDVKIDADKCLYLSLVANELVTNSYKHAVVSDALLRCDLKIEHLADSRYSLSYSDNGKNSDAEPISNQGMNLIKDLMSQVGAKTTQSFHNGYRLHAEFLL